MQFHNIALGIRGIYEACHHIVRIIGHNPLTNLTAARRQYFFEYGIDVLHLKGDVPEPRPINPRDFAINPIVIGKDLQGWQLIFIAGQTEMFTPKVRTFDACQLINPVSLNFPLLLKI